MGGPRDPRIRSYLPRRFSGLRCVSDDGYLLDQATQWWCAMWQMGAPGSLIFIGLVAVMVAVALLA